MLNAPHADSFKTHKIKRLSKPRVNEGLPFECNNALPFLTKLPCKVDLLVESDFGKCARFLQQRQLLVVWCSAGVCHRLLSKREARREHPTMLTPPSTTLIDSTTFSFWCAQQNETPSLVVVSARPRRVGSALANQAILLADPSPVQNSKVLVDMDRARHVDKAEEENGVLLSPVLLFLRAGTLCDDACFRVC